MGASLAVKMVDDLVVVLRWMGVVEDIRVFPQALINRDLRGTRRLTPGMVPRLTTLCNHHVGVSFKALIMVL